MSDDPSRYRFGIEEPLPWLPIVCWAIVLVPIVFAIVLGIWWF